MREYERPVAVVNDELAEGVYMASGDTAGAGDGASTSGGNKSGIKVKKGTVNDWGQNNCQVTFRITLPDGASGSKKVILTCNQQVANAWGGHNGEIERSGQKVILKSGSMPSEFDVTIVGNTGLEVTDADMQDA